MLWKKLGKHTPSGNLRGGKYSLFDAGTKVPFITYWKGKIEPQVSDALVCQLDLLASLAELAGVEIPETDSENMLGEFLGEKSNGRSELVIEATSRTAFRKGNWVVIPPYKGPAIADHVNIELGNSEEFQLYNLSEDIGQQNNLGKTMPEKLQELIKDFEAIRGTDYKEIQALELK